MKGQVRQAIRKHMPAASHLLVDALAKRQVLQVSRQNVHRYWLVELQTKG